MPAPKSCLSASGSSGDDTPSLDWSDRITNAVAQSPGELLLLEARVDRQDSHP